MFQIFLLNLALASAGKIEPYIVGGQEVSIKNWPFIVFLEASSTYGTYACGGSLLSSQTVLTAAHCVDDATMKKTVPGEFTIFMGHSLYTEAKMSRKGIDYEAHKGYDPNDVYVNHDIAVLFLSKPVKFSANVQKVILQKNFDVKRDQNLIVAGWGHTDPEGENGISSRLKAVNMVSKTFQSCKKYPGVICAIASATSATQYPYSGDSGGPIVKTDNHRQVALVSFRDQSEGVSAFTSVPLYYDWIQKHQLKLFKKHCEKVK